MPAKKKEATLTPSKKSKRVQDEKSAEPSFPPNVIAFACLTGRQRFFVPGKNNTFAGLQCENVMFDSGCSSLLLPFPPIETLKPFAVPLSYSWSIFFGPGTKHPTLTIKKLGSASIGLLKLASAQAPIDLPKLRFFIAPQNAKELVKKYSKMFVSIQLADLKNFGKSEAAQPRSHALIGQAILKNYCTVQVGELMLLFTKPFAIQHYAAALAACNAARKEMVPAFPGFNDLEDDDHCGDDEDERRLSFDEIDELIT